MVEALEIKMDFKQTNVGIIPSDWEVKSLGQFGVVSGRVGWKGYTKKDIRNSGPYAIGAKHIDKSNRLDLSDPTYLSIEKYLESPEIMVFKEDILIVQRGSIGKVVLINREIGKATINPSMVIFRLKKNSPVYVFYYLISSPGQNQIIFDTSSTGVPMITQKQVSNFKIPLPPTKAEQTAIATALNDADAFITQLEKLIAKKRAIKQGAMQELLKPKDGWINTTLGMVAQFYKGKGLPKSAIHPDGNVKCIHYGELFTKYKEEIRNISNRTNRFDGAFYSASNDVLMPTSDVTPYGLATASCINEDGVLLGGDVLIIRVDDKEVDGTFLSYCITQNKRQIMQLVSGVTVYHIYASDMNKFQFSYPTIEAQNSIAKVFSDMDVEIEALEKKLDKYKMIKQGMMQNLLTGRIRLV